MPDISLVAMLRVQRDLCDIPRGRGRFLAYLQVMIGGTNDIVLPLMTFNPAGRGRVSDKLDELLALDAEGLAGDAIEEAKRRLSGIDVAFRLGLVLADDAGGGWTNRSHVEIQNRFRSTAVLKRGWAVALAWSSEDPTAQGIRRKVLATIYRTIATWRHGEPRTLAEMMAREGHAAVFAGAFKAGLDAEEIEYTREVLRPHRDATDLTTILPCLYGDRAARVLGNDAFGLSGRAGLALALAEALDSRISPEEALRGDYFRVLNPSTTASRSQRRQQGSGQTR
jgi:hypothetical protein